MEFDKLQIIRPLQEIFDLALKKIKKNRSIIKKKIDKLGYISKLKKLNDYKIKTINGDFKKYLKNIVESFPNIDQLHLFYRELIILELDYNKLKKSLGAVKWSFETIEKITFEKLMQLGRKKNREELNLIFKSYLGRINSIIKQTKKEFEYIEKCRFHMKKFPAVKTKLFTICISGFPNVGKSTLLYKITKSKPEIKNYAFTTKKINAGIIDSIYGKIQFVDTPGTLIRPNKANKIEIHANLALEYLANQVLFIFDLTESSYSIEDQFKLLEKNEEYSKNITAYTSKQDLIENQTIEDFKKLYKSKKIKYKLITEFEDLKKFIQSNLKKWVLDNQN